MTVGQPDGESELVLKFLLEVAEKRSFEVIVAEGAPSVRRRSPRVSPLQIQVIGSAARGMDKLDLHRTRLPAAVCGAPTRNHSPEFTRGQRVTLAEHCSCSHLRVARPRAVVPVGPNTPWILVDTESAGPRFKFFAVCHAVTEACQWWAESPLSWRSLPRGPSLPSNITRDSPPSRLIPQGIALHSLLILQGIPLPPF